MIVTNADSRPISTQVETALNKMRLIYDPLCRGFNVIHKNSDGPH